MLELEFYSTVPPETTTDPQAKRSQSARVVHVVIRLNTSPSEGLPASRYADAIASMDSPSLALPFLLTVTLETTDEEGRDELVKKLPLLLSLLMSDR